MSRKNLKSSIEETLIALGGKKKGDSIRFIKPDLVVRHKDTGIKYTVFDINMGASNHHVYVYRYYGPRSNKKVYVKIHDKYFKDYEPV